VSAITTSFPALGTTVTVAVTDAAALPGAQSVVERELAAIDIACSRFRHDSDLWSINRGAGSPVEVGSACFEAVCVALDVAELTGGLVSPTLGANIRLAGYDQTFTKLRVRDGSSIRPRFTSVAGWKSVAIDPARRTVSVPRGVELDLGATAKALAADRASCSATKATGAGVLVCLGGDIAVAGPAPSGGWPIRIADDHAAPLDSSGPVVAISTGGLASSSTVVRRWTTAGGELHHILDPRTGRPARSAWRTASAVAGSCVLANAATTAAIVLGEAAPAWLEHLGIPARLVTVGGSVATVNGWPAEGS
jgi:thiamine biosynthesis lipoprotein